MLTGISIYPGLDNTYEENITLIKKAAQAGCRRLFTSLHIPETEPAVLQAELARTLYFAKENHLEIISDVSPRTLSMLGLEKFDTAALTRLGITTLRIDFGYGAHKIAEISHNAQGMRLQLNASTITEDFLQELAEHNTDFTRIDALHNFYPRPGTGLSAEFLREKNLLLQQRGIKTGAFIPSQQKPRSPLKKGLPSIEEHRYASVDLAARHLAALGLDSIFIADCLPSKEELYALNRCHDNTVLIKAEMLTDDEATRQLLQNTFTAREDAAAWAIRAQESRLLLTGSIPPLCCQKRQPGDITIDNEKALRYMGELEIILHPQTAEDSVNLAARIKPQEMFLCRCIKPGQKFSFIFTSKK